MSNQEDLSQFGGLDFNDLLDKIRDKSDDPTQDDMITTIKASPYMNTDTLETFLKSNSSKFTILSINLDSIQAKFDIAFAPALKTLELKNLYFQAICIQETHLDDVSDMSLIKLPGYNLVPQGRTCGKKGGLIIYVREMYKNQKMKDLCVRSDFWESLFVEVSNPFMSHPIIIGNIYRPPRENNCNNSIKKFRKE